MGEDRSIDEKLDEILERLSALEHAVSGLERPRRVSRQRRPLTDDPELERRVQARLARLRSSGVFEDWERRMREEDARRGDRDWWLRTMLDDMDKRDPL